MNKKNRQSHNRGQTAVAVDDWVNEAFSEVAAPQPAPADDDTLIDFGDAPAPVPQQAPTQDAQQPRQKPKFQPAPPRPPEQRPAAKPAFQNPAPQKPAPQPPAQAPAPEQQWDNRIPGNLEEMPTKALIAFLSEQVGALRNDESPAADVGNGVALRQPADEPERPSADETPAADDEPIRDWDDEDGEESGLDINPDDNEDDVSPADAEGGTEPVEALDEEAAEEPAAGEQKKRNHHAPAYPLVAAAVDDAAGKAIYEALKSQICGNPEIRVKLEPEDFRTAMLIMPIFRRKNAVYGNASAPAEQTIIRTIRDGYAGIRSGKVFTSEPIEAIIDDVVARMENGDPAVSPAKRIAAAIEDEDIARRLAQVGKKLATEVIDGSHGAFIAAGRYICGGNYLDLQSGNREDKDAFGRAYSQYVAEFLAGNVNDSRSDDEKAHHCLTMLRHDGMLVDYWPSGAVPDDFRNATVLMMKGLASLHAPEQPDVGFIEGECFIVTDGLPASDADTLSFFLAPDGGLYFSAGDREYDGSLPYSYFRAANAPAASS